MNISADEIFAHANIGDTATMVEEFLLQSDDRISLADKSACTNAVAKHCLSLTNTDPAYPPLPL